MQLPMLLSRRNRGVYKNQFGHVLILAGSQRMVGAAALSGLAAMRCGSGLVTLGIPQSLNPVMQKKISPVIMTLPLPQTPQQTIAVKAFQDIKKRIVDYQAMAIGPGLSGHPATQRFILRCIRELSIPMVIDADGLNALAKDIDILSHAQGEKVLTPHPGEMRRLTSLSTSVIADNRRKTALDFASRYHCVLLLKGDRTVVASSEGKTYVNKTGNPGMATAGSGDVLTGMIAALLGQGLFGFEAAKFGAYLHGVAGDLACQQKTAVSMIATDIIEHIPQAFKQLLPKINPW
jgi:NAD(P)H-hydrate epimerase